MTDAPMWNWAEQLLGQSNVRKPTEHGLPMGHAGPAWPGGPLTLNSLRALAGSMPRFQTLKQHHCLISYIRMATPFISVPYVC